MEKITSIKEIYDYRINSESLDVDGWEITTNKQIIIVGISSGKSCCENYGTMSTLDNVNDFIGETLIDICLTKKDLTSLSLDNCCDDDDSMFVTFKTSNGPFQFVLYNSHNGYYGHSVIVRSSQLKLMMLYDKKLKTF